MAVSAELSPSAREVFDQQIMLISLVQRHADGKEVNLYVMRGGKPAYEEHFLFPLKREVQLASVTMEGGRAEVWLVEGWVFSIHFEQSPKTITEAGKEIKTVTVFLDPMLASANPASEGPQIIQSKLPDEYSQLLGESKKVAVNGWAVFGIPQIRKIVQRDGSYYLLAEKEGMGAVGVKQHDLTGQLYYLAYGDGPGEKITVNLTKFFADFDGGKVSGRF